MMTKNQDSSNNKDFKKMRNNMININQKIIKVEVTISMIIVINHKDMIEIIEMIDMIKMIDKIDMIKMTDKIEIIKNITIVTDIIVVIDMIQTIDIIKMIDIKDKMLKIQVQKEQEDMEILKEHKEKVMEINM